MRATTDYEHDTNRTEPNADPNLTTVRPDDDRTRDTDEWKNAGRGPDDIPAATARR